jgi:hypothetical protein
MQRVFWMAQSVVGAEVNTGIPDGLHPLINLPDRNSVVPDRLQSFGNLLGWILYLRSSPVKRL